MTDSHWDGSKPELEGTVQLLIIVLDAPLFAQAVYTVYLLETIANGTLVITLNTCDADEGVNGETAFSFGNDIPLDIKRNSFKNNSSSGEIRLLGRLNTKK